MAKSPAWRSGALTTDQCLTVADRYRPSRRQFLAGLAAAGVRVLGPGNGTLAQTPRIATLRGLDLHHHFVSPEWLDLLNEQHAKRPVMGIDVMRNYTPASSIERMDQAGVATSFLSVTTPGIWSLLPTFRFPL